MAQTWHYGLIAKWWVEFNRSGPEIEFFRSFVEAGEPALDLACGTGRLLLPYRRAGLDVDGCDISPDMLAHCRDQAERDGLDVQLYAQAVHELDLPRRYRTVVFCGGFGLGGERADDVEGLRRVFEHLEPGGTLVLDNEVPYAPGNSWSKWTKEGRSELPLPWRDVERGDRRRGSDGAEYGLTARVVRLDPLAQRIDYEMRAFMWRDDVLVAEELHELKMTLYFSHEVVLMLERAGFVDVEMLAGYERRAPTADDEFVVFVARRPQA